MKKALITGITGQCGSYLAEILLENGYEVHGMIRRISHPNDENIQHIKDKLILHTGDMTDSISINNIITTVIPDEIYNFAAMSQVRVSYDTPASTIDINVGGFLRIIEAVRRADYDCKIYHQSSSEMFGRVQEIPQKETTMFYPRSPYGISKVACHYLARTYREAYGLKIYTGIVFNNESERRGIEFVSRKICVGVAEIVNGMRNKITLGNLDSCRDWGYSKEYMEWVFNFMQSETPDEVIFATGETHSVREFVELAFKIAGIDNWEDYVDYDKSLMRPAEVDILIGDYSKAKRLLGFEPKIKFAELVNIMMNAELDKWKKYIQK